jgi:hypothetical protein
VTGASGRIKAGPQPVQFILGTDGERRVTDAIFVGGKP